MKPQRSIGLSDVLTYFAWLARVSRIPKKSQRSYLCLAKLISLRVPTLGWIQQLSRPHLTQCSCLNICIWYHFRLPRVSLPCGLQLLSTDLPLVSSYIHQMCTDILASLECSMGLDASVHGSILCLCIGQSLGTVFQNILLVLFLSLRRV